MANVETKRKPKAPPILILEERTHLGMIAAMIEGVAHFIARSDAQAIETVERNISKTVEDNRPELEL